MTTYFLIKKPSIVNVQYGPNASSVERCEKLAWTNDKNAVKQFQKLGYKLIDQQELIRLGFIKKPLFPSTSTDADRPIFQTPSAPPIPSDDESTTSSFDDSSLVIAEDQSPPLSPRRGTGSLTAPPLPPRPSSIFETKESKFGQSNASFSDLLKQQSMKLKKTEPIIADSSSTSRIPSTKELIQQIQMIRGTGEPCQEGEIRSKGKCIKFEKPPPEPTESQKQLAKIQSGFTCPEGFERRGLKCVPLSTLLRQRLSPA